MLSCPNCRLETFDGSSCSSCRYNASGRRAATFDPGHLVCAFEERGERCANLGTLSEATRGEGPWYCSQHFPPFAGRRYGLKPTAPPEGFDALKTVLEKKYPALALYERQPGEEG